MRKRTLLAVNVVPGHPSVSELERAAAAGERPRRDYVELARTLEADVVDADYMATRATRVARIVAKLIGTEAAQVAEIYLLRRRYEHIVVFGDRSGFPLALLFKLLRSRRDLVIVPVWLSSPRTAPFMKWLRVQSHFRLLINWGSAPRDIARQFGVPASKLAVVPHPIDERFFSPAPSREDVICSCGKSERDYPTFFRAVGGLDLSVEIALGSTVRQTTDATLAESVEREFGAPVPPNVRLLPPEGPPELRRVYARARFVVVPLKDVDGSHGVSTATEAMAMGKAVIVTRTKGNADLMRDGHEGIFVPPYDAMALRRAIGRLAANPAEAERMGAAGRALVEERHRFDDFVSRFTSLVNA